MPLSFLLVIAVTIIYFAAFLLELFRLVRQQNIAAFCALIGFILHTFLLYQQHIAAEHRIGGAEMFFLASAWGLALIYLIWTHHYPNIPFGLILLPLILLLMGGGLRLASVMGNTETPFRSVGKMLHAAPAAGVMIALSIACTCCVFYFFESYLLHKKRSLPPPIKLPSLEWSLSVCRISSAIAVCCLCLCVLGGILLNISRNAASLWQDPLIIGTLCLFFVLFLGPLKWLFQSHRTTENRFVFILIMLAYIVFLSILVAAIASSNTHWKTR